MLGLVRPSYLAAYAGMCLLRGYQFSFSALRDYGLLSLEYFEAGMRLAGMTFVCGMPAFLLVLHVERATRRAPAARRAASLLLALVAGSAVFALALGEYHAWLGRPSDVMPSVLRASFLVWGLLLGGLLTGLLVHSTRQAELRRRAQDMALASARARSGEAEMRLRQLRTQIEPHFLFNTLSIVKRFGNSDAAAASALLSRLADYIELALAPERMSRHLVRDEVAVTQAYLGIIAMRMGDRLRYEVDVPPELADAPLPPLVLGTLVENAIKHGISPRAAGGHVRVVFRRKDGQLEASVVDDGVGFCEGSGPGLGLANTRARLSALYGRAAALELVSNSTGGITATVRVPMESAA